MAVVHGEIGDDDRNGKCDREYTGQSAQSTDEHPNVSLRHHVAVTDGGHGDQRPPESERNALEVVVRISLYAFRVIDETREYHYAEHEKENEEGEFLRGRPERLDEDLEAGRVPGELEETHDADYGEELHDVGVFEVGGELPEDQVDVEAGRRCKQKVEEIQARRKVIAKITTTN